MSKLWHTKSEGADSCLIQGPNYAPVCVRLRVCTCMSPLSQRTLTLANVLFLTPTPGFKDHLLTNQKSLALMGLSRFLKSPKACNYQFLAKFTNIFYPSASWPHFCTVCVQIANPPPHKPHLFRKGKVITRFRWEWVNCVGLLFVFGHLFALPSHGGICGLSECHDLMKTDMTEGGHACAWVHVHSCDRPCSFSFVSKGCFQCSGLQ